VSIPGWVTVELVELLELLDELGVAGLLELIVPVAPVLLDDVVGVVESGPVHAAVNSRQPSNTWKLSTRRSRRKASRISRRAALGARPPPRLVAG
jgi:hypothetical protein